jgi:hypothetical protein
MDLIFISIFIAMKESFTQSFQRQGSKYALQATFYAEAIMLVLISTVLLVASRSFNVLLELFSYLEIRVAATFILGSFIFAILFGKIATRQFLSKKNNSFLIGLETGLVIIICSTMLASLVAFAIQLIDIGLSEKWALIYFVRPLLWMLAFSILPAAIAGGWFAYKLKKATRRLVS